jgi:two-component system sensor histidine kinase KdpD
MSNNKSINLAKRKDITMKGPVPLLHLPLNTKIYQYFLVVIIIGLTTLILSPLSNSQSYHIVSFILLFVVAMLAVFMGIGPVLLASTISAIAWNYFFIPPFHTFHIEKTEDRLMFVSFFIIALLNGILTNRIRRQERLVRDRENQTNALFQLTEELSKASGIDNVLEVARNDFRKHFNAECWFIIRDGNNKLDFASTGKTVNETPAIDKQIVEMVFRDSVKAGRYTGSSGEAGLTYHPLTGTRLNPGVIAISIDKPAYINREAFWDTYFTQISNALEREFLAELAVKARILDESDKLYETLFNLISHEFRIPIATIMGASDTLMISETSLKSREELYSEIFKATARLNHLIENLLNMSRIESGKISLRPDWCDVNDLVNKVCQNLKQDMDQFNFKAMIPEDMPLVRIDFGLMEHVLYNLLLNSCQHSPVSGDIELNAAYVNGNFILKVTDSGPGFPPHLLPNVFDKFFRVDGSRAGGLGLGLSIVKGLVEAHSGTVRVGNNPEGGAGFTVTIPSDVPDMNDLTEVE